MSNTYMKHLYRILTAFTLSTGIALTIGSSFSYAKAQLTGGGTNVLLHSAAISAPESAATMYEKAYASGQVVVGILLILMGFCLHALLVARDERTVPVKAVPRTHLRSPRWFWIEIRI